MNTWCPAGTRVTTPAIHGRGAVETATKGVPFRWSGLVLVELEDAPGFWELRLLTETPAREVLS